MLNFAKLVTVGATLSLLAIQQASACGMRVCPKKCANVRGTCVCPKPQEEASFISNTITTGGQTAALCFNMTVQEFVVLNEAMKAMQQVRSEKPAGGANEKKLDRYYVLDTQDNEKELIIQWADAN